MGRSANFLPRLVRNLQLRLTENKKVCPRQLLDAALLAPAVVPHEPRASCLKGQGNVLAANSRAWLDFGQRVSASNRASTFVAYETLSWGDEGSAIGEDAKIQHQTWVALETQALLTLPTLSPAGVLQFLFLALRGNFRPTEFLEELHRFLLYGEPAAPPADVFWRLWTANDLALLYKALATHRFPDELLFAQIRARLADNLPHVDACDVALVLTTAAESPGSPLTLALLQPLKGEASLTKTGSGAASASAELQYGLLGDEGPHKPKANAMKEDRELPRARAEEPSSLFVSLLDVFSKQLDRATLNDCVRVFYAAARVYNSLLKSDQYGQLQGHSEVLDVHVNAIHAAWNASLKPLALLAHHIQRLVVAASPRAKLRMAASGVQMWRLLNNPDWPAPTSLHEAVAVAIDAAAASEVEQEAKDLCANSVGNSAQKYGDYVFSSKSSHLHKTGKMTVLRSPLFCTVHEEAASPCGKPRTSAPLAEEPAASFETRSYETAVRDLLTSVLPAVCAASADLSLHECMFLLDLVWQARMFQDFDVPFAWVEGLFFYLAANSHQLGSHQLMALKACFELCFINGSEHEQLSSVRRDKENSIQRQRQHKEVTALLRQRIQCQMKARNTCLTPEERLVLTYIDEVANKKALF